MNIPSIKTIQLLLLLCLFSTSFTPLFGMKRVRSTLFNAYSKTWRGAVTATKWGLSCLPIAHLYYQIKTDKPQFSVRTMHNHEKNLIREELKKCGIKNPERITIQGDNRIPGMSQTTIKGERKIWLKNDTGIVHWLMNSLKIKALSPELKGIIHHEAGHLKYNHSLTIPIATFAIPAITATACFLARKTMKLPTIWWRHLLGKPAQGIALGITNEAAWLWYKKHCEWQADKTVQDDIEILKAMEQYFMSHAEEEKFMIFLLAIHNKTLQRGYPYLAELAEQIFIDPDHPLSYKRAARFRQRWQALEKQQKEQESKKTTLLKKATFF